MAASVAAQFVLSIDCAIASELGLGELLLREVSGETLWDIDGGGGVRVYQYLLVIYGLIAACDGDHAVNVIRSVRGRQPNKPAAQPGDLASKTKGGGLPELDLPVIAYDDLHRPGHLDAPELTPEGAMGAEQTHEGPARIGDSDPACPHRPPDLQHEVAVSRPPGRYDFLGVALYIARHWCCARIPDCSVAMQPLPVPVYTASARAAVRNSPKCRRRGDFD